MRTRMGLMVTLCDTSTLITFGRDGEKGKRLDEAGWRDKAKLSRGEKKTANGKGRKAHHVGFPA